MSLSAGTRLGSYEIVASVGVGGMGEVYRATDTKLKRDVAIKVLPSTVAGDAERLARFQREAEVLAALNHSQIAHIYGVEEFDGTKALVMELVEGPTLADRIARGAVPAEEALPIAKQIAEAVEAAHERGIVHRDLKPSNIKVRTDGTVKVLDFGLAKALDVGATGAAAAAGATALANSPTITSPALTMHGVILGTAAYMSPEQARGQMVDARTDLWAFGCVLFEMLTGRGAFRGQTVTDVLASVVKEEPPWEALPADTPAAIRKLIRRCLTKDRRRRMASAADARIEIEEALESPRTESPVTAARPSRPSPVIQVLGLAVVIAAAAGAYALVGREAASTREPAPVTRFVIPAPPGTQILSGHRELALSTDGQQVAFIARDAAGQHIYVRRLDALSPRQIPGTQGARDLAFSPDGRWLAFHAGNKIQKVSLDGGVPALLADSVHAHGIAWHPTEDAIYFAPHQLSAIWKVPADGGSAPVQVTTIDSARGERSHEWPVIVDDGRTLVFSVNSNAAQLDEESASLVNLTTGERRTVRTGGTAFGLTDRGELLFVRVGSVLGARYDDGRLASPERFESAAAEQPSLSSTGTLAYVPAPNYLRRSLAWISPDGRIADAMFGQRGFDSVAVSRDGRRLAMTIYDDRSSALYVAAPGGGEAPTQIASPAGPPVWSPDGKWIAATVRQPAAERWTISRVAVDGGRNWEVLVDGVLDETISQWAPDGRSLLHTRRDTTGRRTAGLLSLDTTPPRAAGLVERANFIVQSPALSPDGRWLAYESDESGRLEIYLQSYPAAAGRIQVSRDGGSWATWSRRGDAVYFIAGSAIMTSAITTQPELRASAPRAIVNEPRLVRTISGARAFDVAPDGRVLVIREEDSVRSDQIVIVQNWLADAQLRPR